MKKHAVIIFMILTLFIVPAAMATNGSNLIGVGPLSRSMGGVGVAAPQDAIGAIFSNPAAAGFGPFAPGSQADFAGTYFNPTVKGKTTLPTGNPSNPQYNGSDTSNMKPSTIPAIGISSPLSGKWRFGVGAYGVSGMGVSYKESDLFPEGMGNLYTKLEVMNFAPSVAYMVTPDFSLGANFLVSYQNLDLGYGADHGYSTGLQLGGLYQLGLLKFGAAYTYNQGVKHEKVAYFDDYDPNGQLVPDATLDDLELQSPQVLALGVAMEPSAAWLVELDTKWINWSGAEGYKDFDWEDQWTIGIGTQFNLTQAFSLRAGYNYGKNPVKKHDGFDPMGSTNVQGHDVANPNYESLRILGFPAFVEHHLTLGMGYTFANNIALNLSYMYAFENTLKETSAYDAITYESSLKENTLTLGVSWLF